MAATALNMTQVHLLQMFQILPDLSQKESSDSLVSPMDGGEDYRYGGE